MVEDEKLPAFRRRWERLMPESSRSRFWFGFRIVIGALGAGAAIVTFGVAFGWAPVLLTCGISLGLAVTFFLGYVNHRVWIVLGQEMQRADQAEELGQMFSDGLRALTEIAERRAKETQIATELAQIGADVAANLSASLVEQAERHGQQLDRLKQSLETLRQGSPPTQDGS